MPKPKPSPKPCLFGDEGPEIGKRPTPKATAKRLFQAEPEESTSSRQVARTARTSQRGTTQQPVLFGVEPDEPDSSSSESEANQQQPSVFSFGWHNIHVAAKARFAAEAASAGQPPKKKRPYDNSRRASEAAYQRATSSTSHRENGVSQERVLNLLSKEQCLCFLVLK